LLNPEHPKQQKKAKKKSGAAIDHGEPFFFSVPTRSASTRYVPIVEVVRQTIMARQ
jgi:hypothetical protein